jgi:mannan endo-1,4-beta-mannosidase
MESVAKHLLLLSPMSPLRLKLAALVPLIFLNAAHARAQDVILTINAVNARHVIPDSVYGANDLTVPGATVNRHGGNRHTGFNWENNASNAGSDFNHSSDSYLGGLAGIGNTQTPGALLQAWLNADRAQSRKTIITLPLAGYVAADMNGSVTSAQTAPSSRWKEIVADKPGALSLNPDTSDGVVYLEEMVNFLLHHYGTTANGGVAAYSLDNEPALWPSTHPRIHPAATGYAELVSRHTAVAQVTTALDPSAQIYGPVLYGWSAHQNLQNAPDASGFNNTYGTFTGYYLAQMKSASDAAGRRLLHRYDMHWYPEARGDNRIVFGSSPGTNNDIDARLQAPRSLWDPAYVETSWITQFTTNGQGIRLLPRLQEIVDQRFPGTGLAVTEYNYGATDHISGGVAQADVLGIFGRYSTAANFWGLTNNNSYVNAAFQLYRNYNGAGAAFGNVSLDAAASDNSKAGVHAARAANGKLTVVAINRSRTLERSAQLQFTLGAGRTIVAVRTYRLSSAGGPTVQAIATAPAFTANNISDVLPAMSATLYEVDTTAAGFAAWQQEQFGPDATNPEIAGPTADPDRDGLANLMEYVTRRDPRVPETAAPLVVSVVAGGLQLQFQRRKTFTDAQLFLQASPALDAPAWTDSDPATLNPTIVSLDAQTERWSVTVPFDDARKFYRLRAVR